MKSLSDTLIEEAIERGYMKVEDGRLYGLPGLEENMPVLYDIYTAAVEEEIDEAVAGLMEKGLVEAVGVNEDGEIVYQLTQEGLQIKESLI